MAEAAGVGTSLPFLDYGRRGGRHTKNQRRVSHTRNQRGVRRASQSQTKSQAPAKKRRKSMVASQKANLERDYGIDVDCYTKLMPPGYEWKYVLGKGDYGTAILACRRPGFLQEHKISSDIPDCVVIKLQHITSVARFDYETKLHHKFFEAGLAPRLYNVHHWRRCSDNQLVGGMVMDRVTGTLDSMLQLPQPPEVLNQILWWIVDTIDTMCENDLTHGDLHNENICYVLNPKTNVIRPTLIDFGYASDHDCHPQLELLQPLRTLNKEHYSPKINPANERYLFNHLFDIYQQVWAPGLPKTQDAIEEEFERLREQHSDVLDTLIEQHALRHNHSRTRPRRRKSLNR